MRTRLRKCFEGEKIFLVPAPAYYYHCCLVGWLVERVDRHVHMKKIQLHICTQLPCSPNPICIFWWNGIDGTFFLLSYIFFFFLFFFFCKAHRCGIIFTCTYMHECEWNDAYVCRCRCMCVCFCACDRSVIRLHSENRSGFLDRRICDRLVS